MSIHGAAIKISKRISGELGLESGKTEVIAYGLEIIIGELIKFVVLFSVAYFLGIVWVVLSMVLSFTGLRMFAGGAHSDSYARCFLLSVVLLIGGGVLISGLPLLSVSATYSVAVLAALTTGWCVYRWAPGECANKPIPPSARKAYRSRSLVFVAIWGAAAFSTTVLGGSEAQRLVWSSSFALLAEGLSVLPAGYKVLGFVDTSLARLIR